MRLLYPVTGVVLSVHPNDPVMAVQEGYALGPGGTEDHRYQVLFMPKGNVVSAFWRDLGLASEYRMDVDGESYAAPPYHQIVLMEHSVAECQHMAEQGRMDDFAIKLLHEQVNESDLFAKYQMLIEQDMNLVRNRSSFGQYVSVQRNGYSAVGAREQEVRLHGQRS